MGFYSNGSSIKIFLISFAYFCGPDEMKSRAGLSYHGPVGWFKGDAMELRIPDLKTEKTEHEQSAAGEIQQEKIIKRKERCLWLWWFGGEQKVHLDFMWTVIEPQRENTEP